MILPETDNLVAWYYNRYAGRSLEVQRGDEPIADPKDFEHGDEKYLDKDGYLKHEIVKQLAWKWLISKTTAGNYRTAVAKEDDFPLNRGPALPPLKKKDPKKRTPRPTQFSPPGRVLRLP